MSSPSDDQNPVESKEHSPDEECKNSALSSESPRWVGQVQEFFKDKQGDSVRDVFQPLREKFEVFDRANNGIIDKSEFLEALETSGVDVRSTTLREIDNLFESFDIAGNGLISISEFVTVLGKPLIKNPKATVDDIFKETAKTLLMQGNSVDVLNRQWEDICERLKVDPRRGTLTFENFSEMMSRECDWCLTQEQLLPIFKHLDMNDNGKVSIITMRFMVSEMVDSRTEGRTLMVIDLLKQAMTDCQAKVIRKQAETIQRLNEELREEHETLLELEKNNPIRHVCSPSIAGIAGQRTMTPRMTPRRKEVNAQSIAHAFFSWPLLAILGWVTVFILFILTFFASPPEGDFGIDLHGVIIPGLVISILGVVYNITVWPIVRLRHTVGTVQVSMSMTFGIFSPILFALVVAFLNPFWYTDIDCFRCTRCGTWNEAVCYAEWEVSGGWQNTCPCALEDESLWNNAQFVPDSDYPDCNTTLYKSNYFEGKYDRLKPCMFYSNGMFMRVGFAMIIATALVMGASCWGCMKDLHLWVKSVSGEDHGENLNPKETELSTVDIYG